MKHRTLLLALSFATAIGASTETKTLWEGSQAIGNWDWETRLELSADDCAAVDGQGQLVVTLAPNAQAAGDEPWYQYEISANDWVEGRSPERTLLGSGDVAEAGDVTLALSADQAALLKEHGLVVNGHFVVVTKVAFSTQDGGDTPAPDPGVATTLWRGSLSTGGDWSGYVDLSYDNKGALAGAKMGDRISVSFRTAAGAEYANLQLANPDGWVALDEEAEAAPEVKDGEQAFEYEITDVATLETIQRDGLLVRGGNVTITQVDLVTYPESYDAALVTIGEAGVATYSHSSKALDFSATPVRAYVATAVESGRVVLTPIAKVPAYTGVVVRGEKGSYEIPVTEEAPAVEINYLKAVGSWPTTIVPGDDVYRYSLAETGVAKFAPVTEETELPAHKAYLETTADIAPATGDIELVYSDEGGSTGVSHVEAEVAPADDDAWYDLRGVRVSRPSKGIYVHGGKKVVVK